MGIQLSRGWPGVRHVSVARMLLSLLITATRSISHAGV